jgi:hypothetical protein
MADSAENTLVLSLIAANLAVGIGLAVLMARQLRSISGSRKGIFRYFAMFGGIYFLECVAFAFGMCTQVFTITLGLVWGVLFGLWLKVLAPKRKIIRHTALIAFYGCIPTVSFALALLIFWVVSGNGLLNIEQAIEFGIPDFVPRPFNTMLGFCVALTAGTIILKTAFTTGIAAFIVRVKS